MSASAAKGKDHVKLDAASAAKLKNAGIGLAVAGLLLSGAAFATDKHRFAFSYLTGFLFILSIGLGALFFVLIQHLTKAGWSVAARRHMEWLSSILLVAPVLFVPVALFSHDLFHHWMSEHAQHDPIIHAKAGYLNSTFFFVRAGVFLGLWAFLAFWFSKTSQEQDGSGKRELSESMQNAAAPSVLGFGLSTTFAAFDWVMSLDPHWYSTIFGVYFFAGCALSSLATLSLITIQLQSRGLLSRVSTVEHQHDIGKLLFGFVVFWAYIAFSQFLLIWYANIPEETVWYKHRFEGSWGSVSWLLLFGHFVIPFLWLLSRTAKRIRVVLGAGAAWLLFMHYVDLYWLVMPTMEELHHGAHPSWIDLAGLLGPVGVGLAVVAARASGSTLYPVKDPRLAEALRVENL
jgi:hypothetical protein